MELLDPPLRLCLFKSSQHVRFEELNALSFSPPRPQDGFCRVVKTPDAGLHLHVVPHQRHE